MVKIESDFVFFSGENFVHLIPFCFILRCDIIQCRTSRDEETQSVRDLPDRGNFFLLDVKEVHVM